MTSLVTNVENFLVRVLVDAVLLQILISASSVCGNQKNSTKSALNSSNLNREIISGNFAVNSRIFKLKAGTHWSVTEVIIPNAPKETLAGPKRSEFLIRKYP